MSDFNYLSRREREIMDIVYASGEASLSRILEQMEAAPTRPALRSLLNILEDKGHLRHRKAGREFVYAPVRPAAEVGPSTLSRVVKTFFKGSLPQALAAYFSAPGSRLSAEEIREMEALIEKAKSRNRKHR